jgi:hypothetical protein
MMNDVGVVRYRLRIGVTGHRSLPAGVRLEELVKQAVERVRTMIPTRPTTALRLVAISSLAEGADRLVASIVLEDPDAQLEVILPLPLEDFRADFATEESRHDFAQLLDRATRIVELPSTITREEAYEQAGRYVVERSDVLIALWDGQPAHGQGGTGDAVEWARDRGVPVLWVHTEPPITLTVERDEGIPSTPYEELDRYNRASLPHEQLVRDMERYAAHVSGQARRSGIEHATLRPFSDWLAPFFVRADLLASRYQKRFFLFSDAVFAMAALAVIASAGTELASRAPAFINGKIFSRIVPLPLIEFSAMLLVLVVIRVVRRQAFHRGWISHRVLAERLRSALFLALISIEAHHEHGIEHVSLHQSSDEWLDRAYEDVWSQRPPTGTSIPMDRLKRFLAKAWIGDQVSYQKKKSHRHEWNNQWIANATVVIFVITLVIAGLSAVGVIGENARDAPLWATFAVYLEITLPAVASALGGIGAQREHRRNANRSGQMARYLASLEQRMDTAADQETVGAVARQAEAIMVEDIDDWFVTMEYRDVELQGG